MTTGCMSPTTGITTTTISSPACGRMPEAQGPQARSEVGGQRSAVGEAVAVG